MKKRSIKRQIFLSNTLMVVSILAIFLFVNTVVVRSLTLVGEHYTDTFIEEADDFRHDGRQGRYDDDDFLLWFVVDGVVSIAVLLGVSTIFTNRMTRQILVPLNKLSDASERIRHGNLSEDIVYSGIQEFEDACCAFNEMQHDILVEQERNRKYEKARTDMIAGISHDLRTPLTAIRGTVKGLRDGVASSPDMREKFLETAYRRTEEMDVLLSQLFFFSSMETGKLPIIPMPVLLNSYAVQYVSDKRCDPKYADVEFAVEQMDAQLTVSADPEQLRRILDNLLENSMKYANANPLRITLAVCMKDDHAQLRFSDNGIGASNSTLEHIFEEFYRGDDSRNRENGNGLGLYIVKYLTEAMKGTVSAESANGLSVILSFPIETGASQ